MKNVKDRREISKADWHIKKIIEILMAFDF